MVKDTTRPKTRNEREIAGYRDVLNTIHENHDYIPPKPFVKYMLSVVVAAYRDFSARVALLTVEGRSKPDRIRELIKGTWGSITKSEILEKCPDISQITVQRTLAELVENGQVIKIGGGRYTKYTWNREKMGDR